VSFSGGLGVIPQQAPRVPNFAQSEPPRFRQSEPLSELTVSEWADQNRKLGVGQSASPGPWRTEFTEYLREIMNSFNDPKVKRIVFMASAQVGKTEFLNNVIGYHIAEEPCPILCVQPTVPPAKNSLNILHYRFGNMGKGYGMNFSDPSTYTPHANRDFLFDIEVQFCFPLLSIVPHSYLIYSDFI
jgi:hypothetical protein